MPQVEARAQGGHRPAPRADEARRAPVFCTSWRSAPDPHDAEGRHRGGAWVGPRASDHSQRRGGLSVASVEHGVHADMDANIKGSLTPATAPHCWPARRGQAGARDLLPGPGATTRTAERWGCHQPCRPRAARGHRARMGGDHRDEIPRRPSACSKFAFNLADDDERSSRARPHGVHDGRSRRSRDAFLEHRAPWRTTRTTTGLARRRLCQEASGSRAFEASACPYSRAVSVMPVMVVPLIVTADSDSARVI